MATDAIELMRLCTACKGEGTVRGKGKHGNQVDLRCDNCQGRGWVPSPAGLALITFLGVFSAPVIQELQLENTAVMTEDRARIVELTKRLERIESA